VRVIFRNVLMVLMTVCGGWLVDGQVNEQMLLSISTRNAYFHCHGVERWASRNVWPQISRSQGRMDAKGGFRGL